MPTQTRLHTRPSTFGWHHRSPPSQRTTRLVSLTAAGVALVSWFSIHVAGGVDLEVDGRAVGGGQIVATALGAALAGWALLASLERVLADPLRAGRVWQVIAVAVALVSLLGPMSADADWTVRSALLAIHANVACTIVMGLRPRGRPRRRPA